MSSRISKGSCPNLSQIYRSNFLGDRFWWNFHKWHNFRCWSFFINDYNTYNVLGEIFTTYGNSWRYNSLVVPARLGSSLLMTASRKTNAHRWLSVGSAGEKETFSSHWSWCWGYHYTRRKYWKDLHVIHPFSHTISLYSLVLGHDNLDTKGNRFTKKSSFTKCIEQIPELL